MSEDMFEGMGKKGSMLPVLWYETCLKDIVDAVTVALSEYGYDIGPVNDYTYGIYWYYDYHKDVHHVRMLRNAGSHEYVVLFEDNGYCKNVVIELDKQSVKVECMWDVSKKYNVEAAVKEFEMLNKVAEKVAKVIVGEKQ